MNYHAEDARRLMEKMISKLKASEGRRVDRVESVLDSLVDLHLVLEGDGELQEELERFKSNFSFLLFGQENFGGVNVYVHNCLLYAQRGRTNGFEEACWRRSVLYVLDEEYMDWGSVGSPELRDVFREDIEDIDETIEDVSDQAPPVRESHIPSWATAAHWWWRAPKQQDMSEEERISRLEYDFLDGVED